VFTRLAELSVHGANVQEGQIVLVAAEIGLEEQARATAAAAYKRGAKFVDVAYFDPYLKRVRIESADPDTLDFVPQWYGERVLEHAEQNGARILLRGVTAPNAMDGLDKSLLGKDMLPSVKETLKVIDDDEASNHWTSSTAIRIGPRPLPRQQHAKASLACARDGGEPEGRLPDPGFALEHESGWPLDGTVQERVHGAELLVTPNDLAHHHARNHRDSAKRRNRVIDEHVTVAPTPNSGTVDTRARKMGLGPKTAQIDRSATAGNPLQRFRSAW
jgi:hypothetical protein